MNWRWMVCVSLVAAGCSDDVSIEGGDGEDEPFLVDGKADAFGVSDDSPLADGVLRLVNSASFHELDVSAALDRRAATAIVTHRDGVDGRLGTADDDLYDTLQELDDTPWVGPAAFARLVEYAEANGYVNHASGASEFLPPLAEARTGHASTLLSDGRVLVVGGSNDEGVLSSGEVFDPATDTWSSIAPMATPRTAAAATLLADGRVLVTGGLAPASTSSRGLRTAEIWDPDTDTWTSAGEFEGGRYDHTATLLDDGRVVVIGGQEAYNTYTHINVEVFDPATVTWSTVAQTPIGVQGHTATMSPDGRVIVTGGYNRFTKRRTRAIQAFDPSTDTVTVVGRLQTARDEHTATSLGGELLIAGGRSDRHAPIADAEIVDLTTFETRRVGSLVKARSNHTATVLPSGEVVLIGGDDGSYFSGLTEVDVYDPATETWGLGEPLAEGRTSHVAHLVDGAALVIGGRTRQSSNLATLSYESGPVTQVDAPVMEPTLDWDPLINYGESIGCGANELVFHEALDQLVCFKGRSAEHQPIATYGWTAQGWVEIADAASSPTPPRTGHTMAYDAARERIVLFGGEKRRDFHLNDVWEFDGTRWVEVTPADATVPAEQTQAAMVWDSTRERSVVVPGRTRTNAPRPQELWAWDGVRWTTIPGSNTAHLDGRYGYDAVYDPVRDRIVVLGGYAGGGPLTTWEFDGTRWQQGGYGAPSSGRVDATYDPIEGVIVAITGDGVWRYDGTWSGVHTEYRFESNNFNQGMAFDRSTGHVTVGGQHLMQLREHVAPNQRPLVGFNGRRILYPNEPFELSVSYSDPDGHDLEVDVQGLPDGATFDAETGLLSWTPRPDQAGDHTVVVTASDGALAQSRDILLKVEGLIHYPMLPTGTIDLTAAVNMSGTVLDRRRQGYDRLGGTFRVTCDFTGQNPGRVMWVCRIVKTSVWPYDWQVVTAGQLHASGNLNGGSNISGVVEALQWEDYQLRISRFDVSWQSGQELWLAGGDYTGYLDPN